MLQDKSKLKVYLVMNRSFGICTVKSIQLHCTLQSLRLQLSLFQQLIDFCLFYFLQ